MLCVIFYYISFIISNASSSNFSLCALKLLVSIHIYGEAALYIQKLASFGSKDVMKTESNDSFRPSSVQELFAEFDSDANLQQLRTPVHTSELKKKNI